MTIQSLEETLAQRPDSPLFALLANEYLIAGRAEDATHLCTAGLNFYPSYTTAYWILAKCHATTGDFQSALSALQDIKSLGCDSPLIENFYQQCLMHLVSMPQPDMADKRIEFAARAAAFEEPANADEPPMSETLPSEAPLPETTVAAIESAGRPGLSAEELAQIRPVTIEDEKRIVSRTLAEIYATQGEYGEAILTYRLLQRERPDLASEFMERIRELNVLLQQKLASGQQQETPD